MSKNNDNWERLVRAVLLRDELRQVALCHSREPSSDSFISPSDAQELFYFERIEIVKERLLGLSIIDDEVQTTHQSEDEIHNWIKAANAAIRILFQNKRRLCNYGDDSSVEVVRGSIIQLLNFANAVARGGRTPERLFKLLDVYETLRDLIPRFELIVSDQYCESLRNEAITIRERLREEIKAIFMELEHLIRKHPVQAPVPPGGGLHPITGYVMNYLRAACLSRITLQQVLFDENDVLPLDLSCRRGEDMGLSWLAVQMAWFMELLESNLEAKSKAYKDPALRAVFMLNNVAYILEKAKEDELETLFGKDWIMKRTDNVREYRVSYQRNSWNKVLSVLHVDNFTSKDQSLKEKLSLFNSYFEEICRTQTSWVVFEEQLREDLRFSVSLTLRLVYCSFIKRVKLPWYIGKPVDRYTKYSMEDVEARISELFQGTSTKSK